MKIAFTEAFQAIFKSRRYTQHHRFGERAPRPGSRLS